MPGSIDELAASIDEVAASTKFSGVVRVDRDGETVFAAGYGAARRDLAIANTLDTRFALASGAKTFTALTVMGLVDDGTLELATTARSVLGADLPLIDDAVTVEHLLSHFSGIGDYLDENNDWSATDYVMPVPVHELATTEDYLKVLDGFPQKARPGERFEYCNGGYVVLALIAERASGTDYHELVAERVCRPAGLDDTAFLRSDELPGNAAFGYLANDGPRTNLLHLPVRGTGDGGIWSTVGDIHRLWHAIDSGSVLSDAGRARMLEPRGATESGKYQYGLGVWLVAASGAVFLEGYDAGVSFRSTHDRSNETTFTVISNWTDGAWPVASHLADALALDAPVPEGG